MQFRFDGKRALVTGAGSGIGREIALRLIESGAIVTGVGRTRSTLEETGGLAAIPGRFMIRQLDLASAGQIQEFGDELIQEDRPLHVLVNNAGIFQKTLIEDLTPERYSAMMDNNLRSVMLLSRVLLPLLRREGGSIVNIASTLGFMAVPGFSLYSAAKAGLIMFSKSLALECGREGIRCNVISPGAVNTSIFEQVMPAGQIPEFLRAAAARYPLGRTGQPADIAAATLFLASDAAGWITGVNLPVDGGIALT